MTQHPYPGSYRRYPLWPVIAACTALAWLLTGLSTPGSARGRYTATAEITPVPGSTTRADVAEFLVTAAETDTWIGKAVQLGG